MQIIPASAVIPTLDRRERLIRTVSGLFAQDVVPAEIIVVDASAVPVTASDLPPPPAGVRLRCEPAARRGAAAQRNQAVAASTQPFIQFTDDDLDFAPGCLAALWRTMQSDSEIGACGVLITNLHYHPPGRGMRRMLSALGCPHPGSLAGRCAGPALNFLPAASDQDQPVQWMNLCCTLVRRSAMPTPPLLAFFHGYSLMEDAALTLEIGKRSRLVVPAGARVFHDNLPGAYKDRAFTRERMEVINRWFVMRCIMGRDTPLWDLRQFLWQLASLALSLRASAGWSRLPAALAGKAAGLVTVLLQGHRWHGYKSDTPA